MDWQDVRYFFVLAQSGSLSSAARGLGVEHTTIARRVTALERALDVRSFKRLPRGWRLTQEGRELLPFAENLALSATSLERRALGAASLAGTVRVLRGDAEIALRIGAVEVPAGLVVRKVGSVTPPQVPLRMWHPRPSFLGSCMLVALAGVLACESSALSPSQLTVARPRPASAPSAQERAPHTTPQAPPTATPPRAIVKRQLLSERACQAEVFAVQGRTFVACGEELLGLEAGQLRSEPALARGLKLDANALAGRALVSVAGRWPDALWAATREVSGGGNSTKLSFFRFRKDRWAKVGASLEVGGPEGRVVFPWTDDGLGAIAARAFEPTRFLSFSAKPVATPRLAKAVQSQAERQEYRCENQLIYPETWARLGPGDVMVFSGQLCGAPEEGEHSRLLGVERLRVGQAVGEVTLLPVPDEAPASTLWAVVASAALSPAQVLVAANGFERDPPPSTRARRFAVLARWDGSTWRAERSPLTEITGVWALGDRFAVTDEQGALWLEREGQWTAVEWIADEPSSDAWSRGSITQLVATDGAWWLVKQEEQRPDPPTSRLYRLEVASPSTLP